LNNRPSKTVLAIFGQRARTRSLIAKKSLSLGEAGTEREHAQNHMAGFGRHGSRKALKKIFCAIKTNLCRLLLLAKH